MDVKCLSTVDMGVVLTLTKQLVTRRVSQMNHHHTAKRSKAKKTLKVNKNVWIRGRCEEEKWSLLGKL